ncbi:methyl-accepting chemotaxis protein [Pseudomonas aeruginosa]|uniref:methyl-accepting chemotaxis protein n=1 Tax=Pseudomonas aeruginosa TaxID=287 RepID=UPI0029500DEE|nr:methyl-accepting chemotaxis protein [Pseudomonas aeruginosa]MDV6843463.1 methyl-accepting chemotaxis protein [Pseudomonas aeruginosa]HCI2542547.1 methyl-accepting chemotaxis protein [Pseudomonas aeruginosa]HCI4078838.1 methyl-accepting chemotaxis protein [Pseudomonas aeruginosa]
MLQWFANLSFRRKIALPILLLAVLLLLVGALGVHGIAQLNESNQRLGKRFLPGIALLLNADRDLYQAFVAERSLLEGHLSAEQIAGLRNDHAENLQQALDRVRQYAAMQPGEAELAKVAEFERGYALWSATSARVLSLAASDPSAAAQLSYGDSDRQFGAMREVINQLDEMEEAAAAADGEASSALVAFGLLVCLSLVLVFPGLVTRPLQRLLQRLEEIANGDGDLRVRLEVTSRDEPGRLGSAFNAFLDKLQPLIREVGRVTGEVADSAGSLAGMTAANDRLINSEHASVDQVSTAATQMSSAVHEVARNAQSAAQVADDARRQAREGANVVEATIEVIRQLAQEVESSSESIQQLAQETASIDAVLTVIKGIAEQTNLLALNAAIEAARAGEQGRGFAVVADEVRALAARTQDSTKDIQARIERLQAGVQNAVRAMQSGSLKARDSVERAAGVDGVLAATGDAVGRINDLAAQIASACEEQSRVIDEIARNISEVRELSAQAAEHSEQGTGASRRLSELSSELARLVGRFRV